jgi:hypothetical protein
MKSFLFGLALCGGIWLAGSPASAQENLLKNPNLEVDAGSQTIPGWTVAPRDTVVENSDSVFPDETSSSLAVTIGEVQDAHGQIGQRIKIIPGEGRSWTICGWLMSNEPGAAYLQVKLYKDGKEVKRVDIGNPSNSQWNKVSESLTPENADSIEVLCRWLVQERTTGKKVYFANISVTE